MQRSEAELTGTLTAAATLEKSLRQELGLLQQQLRAESAAVAAVNRDMTQTQDALRRAEVEAAALRKEMTEIRKRHAAALQAERASAAAALQVMIVAAVVFGCSIGSFFVGYLGLMGVILQQYVAQLTATSPNEATATAAAATATTTT